MQTAQAAACWAEDLVGVATGFVEDLLGVLDDHFAVNCSLVEGNLR